MNVYVAAPFQLMSYAQRVMEDLETVEIHVTSRWLRQDGGMTSEMAQMDLDDIDRADMVIALNPIDWANMGTGGRHFECGYAYAKGKPVLIVGDKSNIFHLLTHKIRVIEEGDDIIKHAREMYLEYLPDVAY